MTTLTARFDGKVLVPDHPVDLPTGVPLRVSVEFPSDTEREKPVWQVALDIGASVRAQEWEKVPTDLGRNLDHYLYGAPKDDA